MKTLLGNIVLLSSGCWLRHYNWSKSNTWYITYSLNHLIYIYCMYIVYIYNLCLPSSSWFSKLKFWNLAKKVSRQVLGIGGKFFQWSFRPGWLLLILLMVQKFRRENHLKYMQMGCINYLSLNWWVYRISEPSTVLPGWQTKTENNSDVTENVRYVKWRYWTL